MQVNQARRDDKPGNVGNSKWKCRRNVLPLRRDNYGRLRRFGLANVWWFQHQRNQEVGRSCFCSTLISLDKGWKAMLSKT